jgi:hypothetical protein
MFYIQYSAILIILSVFYFSCSRDTPLQPDGGGNGNTPPVTENLSKFSQIQKQVFDVSCAVAGCHTGSIPAGNLNLSAAESYNQLVDVSSLLYPARKRVNPNQSLESVLILLLRGSLSPRMPQGRTPLSGAVVDSIAKWIDRGAPNN